MLFVSSNSVIEQNIFHRLHLQTSCIQSNIRTWLNGCPDNLPVEMMHEKCLVYSFQHFESYKHLESFEVERKAVEHLIQFIQENSFQRIILLSYPGAYFNAQNLFLKYKGIIEQKFTNTEIPCTIFNVQGIHDIQQHRNNLHGLFYDRNEHKLVIPQKRCCVVYSIQTGNLVSMILKAWERGIIGKFDAFDTIYELKTYVALYSNIENVQRVAPIYLYFKSFIGAYASPTMLELFLMSIVPMYKFRTEKEFGISLEAEKHGIYMTYNKPLVGITSPYNSILKSLIPSE